MCIDRQSGTIVWDKSVPAVLPEERYGGMFAENGYASHTPVSDGERVYAFFGKSGVHAFDLDGKRLWEASVGTDDDRRGWGTASSPILYRNLLIVPATIESHAMVALDKLTGKEVWRQEAEGFGSTWGTPALVELSEDRTDLVIAVPFEIWGLNPENGKLRWYCESVDSDSMCSSVLVDGKTVYAIEGRSGGAIAVRAGGEGDVSKTHVVWTGRQRNRIGTPVIADGRLYWVNSGIANCLDAQTGEEIYQERIEKNARVAAAPTPASFGGGARFGGGRFGGGPGGQDYSSPVTADGKLYYATRSGDVVVVRLGQEFEQLACNRFESDEGEFNATPAISDGDIYIRSTTHLYCVSEEAVNP
jgi:outer membrane protein assembly factor BamB